MACASSFHLLQPASLNPKRGGRRGVNSFGKKSAGYILNGAHVVAWAEFAKAAAGEVLLLFVDYA